jgi:hypothetical protein
MMAAMADHHAHDHAHHDHDHAHDHDHDHDHLVHVHHPEDIDLEMVNFDVFGVPLAVSAPKAVLPRVYSVIPPGAAFRERREGDEYFILSPFPQSEYRITHGPESIAGSSDLKVALEVLGQRIREHVAINAPRHTFVHSGAVAHNGRAIIIPGPSFSGKTTLVAELVKAGATYYSDEFAVLDQDGLVHPYAKPLAIRNGGWEQTDHDVAAFGGTQGSEPLPIGLVVLSWYERDAAWTPRRLSTGEAVLAVLSNTVPANDRPDQSLSAITKALADAVTLEGPRGDAAALAAELLNTVIA